MGIATAPRVSRSTPTEGVRPSRASAAFNSIRPAPPAAAAIASSTVSTHTSSSTLRACGRPFFSIRSILMAAPSANPPRLDTAAARRNTERSRFFALYPGVAVVKRLIGGVVGASVVFSSWCLVGCATGVRPSPGAAAPRVAATPAPQPAVMLLAGGDQPVARLPGLVIGREQFLAPLIESHGLSVLLNVVQLELAR